MKNNTWTFWHSPTNLGVKRIFSTRICKAPNRTKDWKQLNELFEADNEVKLIGYFVGKPEDVLMPIEYVR